MTQNDFWSKLKKRLKEVSTAAADFTEEQAIIGKLKFNILTLRRKIDHLYRDIGAIVVEMSKQKVKPNVLNDPDIKNILGKIADLENQVEDNRRAITAVSDEFRARAAARQQAAEAERQAEKKWDWDFSSTRAKTNQDRTRKKGAASKSGSPPKESTSSRSGKRTKTVDDTISKSKGRKAAATRRAKKAAEQVKTDTDTLEESKET